MTHFLIVCLVLAFMVFVGGLLLNFVMMILGLAIAGIVMLCSGVINLFKRSN